MLKTTMSRQEQSLLLQAQSTEEHGPGKSSDSVLSPVDNLRDQNSTGSPSSSPRVLSLATG